MSPGRAKLSAALLLLLPSIAAGHACEFLVARLEIQEGSVKLAVTADYGGNPLLADVDTARQALQQSLQVRHQGHLHRLEELAPLQMESATQWDPRTPAVFAPSSGDPSHQLLVANWRWRPDQSEIAFAVPRGNLHDVLLWMPDPAPPGYRWQLLIEGETSSAITLPSPAFRWWGFLWLPLLGACVWFARAYRSRSHADDACR